jgi:hypothetical protein
MKTIKKWIKNLTATTDDTVINTKLDYIVF